MSHLIPVDGEKNFYRDPLTNAIINTNKDEYELYLKKRNSIKNERKKIEQIKNEMKSVKSELNEIKTLLKEILEK